MIENPITQSSEVLIYSNQFNDGSELVLVVGYTALGKFGYFVTYLTKENQYENTIKFIGKTNENSYNEILEVFKELTSLNN